MNNPAGVPGSNIDTLIADQEVIKTIKLAKFQLAKMFLVPNCMNQCKQRFLDRKKNTKVLIFPLRRLTSLRNLNSGGVNNSRRKILTKNLKVTLISLILTVLAPMKMEIQLLHSITAKQTDTIISFCLKLTGLLNKS